MPRLLEDASFDIAPGIVVIDHKDFAGPGGHATVSSAVNARRIAAIRAALVRSDFDMTSVAPARFRCCVSAGTSEVRTITGGDRPIASDARSWRKLSPSIGFMLRSRMITS